jgi:hypothetical protein
MTVEILTADRGMIGYILEDLRDLDRAELEACDSNLDRLPEEIMRHRVFAFCAFDHDYGPISIWGMVQRRKNVGGGFAFGTDLWPHAVLPMVRHIRRFVLPFLKAGNYHRVEALALSHRQDVARFMSLIGAEPEAVLRAFGKGGEDFISYRWLADEYEHRTSQTEDSHAAH